MAMQDEFYKVRCAHEVKYSLLGWPYEQNRAAHPAWAVHNARCTHNTGRETRSASVAGMPWGFKLQLVKPVAAS
jgi:hypothetical protein